MSDENPLGSAVISITKKYNADVIVYIGVLSDSDDETLIRVCRARKNKRKNVLLILSTPGGSADAAYRIARCLQRSYDVKAEEPTKKGQFILYVHDFCKSAGTLLSLGASTLIMSQSAQLGPIDVQLLKEDEVGERRSGLAPRQALETMSVEAGTAFRRLFRNLRSGQLSTKMAAELAAKITIGVMEPIYGQLDPIRLGEVERYVRIAQEYGERLRTPNVRRGTIEKLLGGYPSHEFVIDRDEARELFDSVAIPSDELEFVAETFIEVHHPTAENLDSFISYINPENKPDITEKPHGQDTDANERAGPAGAQPVDGQVRPDAERDEGSDPDGEVGSGSMEQKQAAE